MKCSRNTIDILTGLVLAGIAVCDIIRQQTAFHTWIMLVIGIIVLVVAVADMLKAKHR